MKVYTSTRKIIEEDGVPSLVIGSEAIADTIKMVKCWGRYIVGYLVPDENAEDPTTEDEGLGYFVHWAGNSKEEYRAYCEARGFDPDAMNRGTPKGKPNPDAVLIDKYEHSGVCYSVAGEGTQCRWDTSNAWAVWLPSYVLRDELKGKTKAKRRAKCVEFARQACEVFNKWANGEVYAASIHVFDGKGEEVESAGDIVCGYYGVNDAEKGLDEMIKAAMKAAKAEAKKKGAKRK